MADTNDGREKFVEDFEVSEAMVTQICSGYVHVNWDERKKFIIWKREQEKGLYIYNIMHKIKKAILNFKQSSQKGWPKRALSQIMITIKKNEKWFLG